MLGHSSRTVGIQKADSTACLAGASFATGSGVIDMIRQAAIAIGVAIFVAIVGTQGSLQERIAVYHRA